MSKSTKIRVACYCRVSTTTADQANSLTNQIDFFNDVLKDNPDYKLYHPTNSIYYDLGLTGTKLRRESFDRLLIDAGLDINDKQISYIDELTNTLKVHTTYILSPSGKVPKFEEIWVRSTNRFARNVEINGILRALANVGVFVRFIDINKCTRNTEDILAIQIFQSFDENFSRDLSRKVRFGNERGAKNFLLRTNPNLYGYNYDKNERKLKINKDEAEVVRKIFNWYEEGYGTRVIANKLKSEGIKTRKGNFFGVSSLKKMLENEKYSGFINSLKFDTGVVFENKHYPKVRDNYLLKFKPEIVPVIINPAQFKRCRKQKREKASKFVTRGEYTGSSPYKRKLRCALCNYHFMHNVDAGRGFFNCGGKKRYGTEFCNALNVQDHQINDYIASLAKGGINDIITYQLVSTFLELSDIAYEIIAEINKPKSIDKIDSYKTEINEQEKIVAGLYLLAARSGAVTEVLDSQISATENQINEIKLKLKTLTKKPNQYILELEVLLEQCETIIDFLSRLQLTYTVEEIMEMIEEIIIDAEFINNSDKVTRSIIFDPIIKLSILPEINFTKSVKHINITPHRATDFSINFAKSTLIELQMCLDSLKRLYI